MSSSRSSTGSARNSRVYSTPRRTTKHVGSGTLKSKRSQVRTTKSEVTVKTLEDIIDTEPPEKCFCENCKMRFFNRDRNPADRFRLEVKLMHVHKCIADQTEEAVGDLEQLVKMKSISVKPEHLKDSCEALEWMANRLAELKFRTHLYPIDNDPNSCFLEPQQKVLFANYFSSPTKNTVLIYAHLDVVPAIRDCWFSDPFELSVREGMLYGRGVTSGKGMVVGWLQAIECWLKIDEDLPMNVKIIVDMLHEVGSEGLQDIIQARKDYFLDVDYVIFDTNSWLNSNRPVIACGLTGWAYFGVEVRGGSKSLEVGLSGPLDFEPMTDICHLMNSLVNKHHDINIPHIDHMVKRLTTEEWHLLETADFSTYKYSDELGIRRLRHEGVKVDVLQSRWCKPALTMHGVQGGDNKAECSRILPMLVKGKFSIKLVPDQELAHVHNAVKEHLVRMSTELKMGTQMKVQLMDACEPTSWSTTSKITKAVIRAVSDVFQKEPIASAGIPVCLPIASVFRKLVDKPIILVPYSMRLDRHLQENEYIEEDLFMRHARVCASLLFELSGLPIRCKCGVIKEYCHLRGVAERLAVERGTEEKEPIKRNLLNSMLSRKTILQSKKTKKTIRDYLCMPFGWKKSTKTETHRKKNNDPRKTSFDI